MHEGHRERLFAKLSSGAQLAEHEVLEILLFYAIPRVNTNPIAHRLLDCFGDLDSVLSASEEELQLVAGVGENAARFLKVASLLTQTVGARRPKPLLSNFGEIRGFVKTRLENETSEMCEFYFLSKDSRVQRIRQFTTFDRHKVKFDTDEIICLLSAVRPDGVIVAHNHPAAGCAPSNSDDNFTCRIQAICAMNNVNFVDHCIYSNPTGEVYSYRSTENKLDKIKAQFNAADLLDAWINKFLST